MAAHRINREIALLDVAQEYVLEYLRREGAFDGLILFKGGTALRKFVFGATGRFSVDLDFGMQHDDDTGADFILGLLDGASIGGVSIRLERRRGSAANLRLETALGPVTEPAAVSIRQKAPWLPPQLFEPLPFQFLDLGLQPDFARIRLPVLDVREIAAEKIAAFWRRRMARDLYDLNHLGRVMQSTFDGRLVCTLAALKIYFDVVEERSGSRPLGNPAEIFGLALSDVVGQHDLSRFGAGTIDIGALLTGCRTRYGGMTSMDADLEQLLTTCSSRDQFHVCELRDRLVANMLSSGE
jgi:predicted nucleotidyltransferase component of viral defense system